jgi:small subunit ribosomal protein S2
MEEFLYGSQEGVHVFDLTITKEKLEEALSALTKAAKEGKNILFVCTKKQAKAKAREIAQTTDTFFVTERWLGGILTNFEQIDKSLKKMAEMKEKMAAGDYSHFTKKERLLLEREITRLERFFGGMSGMEEIPDVLVVVDTRREAGALKEAQKKGVETIGIVDSNADPTQVDYPIPMNDDASKALEYVLDLMEKAILEGKKKTKKK